MQSVNLWTALGKPRTYVEFDNMRYDKFRYKRAIKTNEESNTNQFLDSHNEALLQKDIGFLLEFMEVKVW